VECARFTLARPLSLEESRTAAGRSPKRTLAAVAPPQPSDAACCTLGERKLSCARASNCHFPFSQFRDDSKSDLGADPSPPFPPAAALAEQGTSRGGPAMVRGARRAARLALSGWRGRYGQAVSL